MDPSARFATSKRMLPRVTPQQVAEFFRATEPNAKRLAGSEFPVYEPFPGCRRYCQIEITTISGLDWRKGQRVKQVDRDGNPLEHPRGEYIVVDADDVRQLDYVSCKGSSVHFILDGRDGLLLATTDLLTLGSTVERRLENLLAPLSEWMPF